jgi:hypothetical protein
MRRGLQVVGIVGLLLVALSPTVWKGLAQTPQPIRSTEWVAFSADLRIDANGPSQLGKFYRSRDGSTRTEQVLDNKEAIVIANHGRALLYRGMSGEVWTEQPLVASGKGPSRPSQHALSQMAPCAKLEGLEAVEWRPASGTRVVLIPALNYFQAVIEKTGIRVEYSNLKVGDQDASLFEPPVGTLLRRLSKAADVPNLVDRKEGGSCSGPNQ